MYNITISKTAEKEIKKLPKNMINRIVGAIDLLIEEPHPIGSKKLKGTTDNLWRLRVGDYRVIYDIMDKIRIIDFKKIRHRRDVYQ